MMMPGLKGFPTVWHVFACALLLCVDSRAGDRAPSPLFQQPNRQIEPLVVDKQIDSFSCGFHALSAIYRSHGLDPAKANLKSRLGTAVNAVPFVSDSKGTLQPDIFRVLKQDGFLAESITSFESGNLDKVRNHLNEGYLTLSLFRMGNGGMHWVVFTGADGENIIVADSLKPDFYEIDLHQFAEERLLNVILLLPDTPSPGSPYFSAHLIGIREMLRSAGPVFPVLGLLALAAVIFAVRWIIRRKVIR